MGLLDWFGSSTTDDEPVEEQRKDISEVVSLGGWKIYDACDEIPGGNGRFGFDGTNPIPVNGPVGETVYLNRLRGKSGIGFFYHRLGTVRATFIDAVIDRFELVALDASEWAILNLCPYFPRRSLKAPAGMSLARWRDANAAQRFMLKHDSFGRRKYVENFPLDLPPLVAAAKFSPIAPRLGAAAAARMQEFISANAGKWTRPYKLTPEITGAPVPGASTPGLIEPRRPDIPNSKPVRFFEIGDFTLGLLENPPVLASDGLPREPILAALIAMSRRQQLIEYTVQVCVQNRPPTICVWQLDGRYRVLDTFSDKWKDLKTFTDFALPAIRKELGLEHLPIAERFGKQDPRA
jgi:hypothetical protein